MTASCLDVDVLKLRCSKKILLVGAGGIGCEVLKDLVEVGFEDILVVDLDTIDISNLNRQLLFRREDVGGSKAEVAVARCQKMLAMGRRSSSSTLPGGGYGSKIRAFHGRVQDLPSNAFEEADVVLNALDNRVAREYVNQQCHIYQKLLIDSGTAGFNGQVFPIFTKEGFECYSCRPAPKQKGFPVCTIRSSPEHPEHCIAWAMHLYEAVFAEKSNMLCDMHALLDSALSDLSITPEQRSTKVLSILFEKEVCNLQDMAELAEKKKEFTPLEISSIITSREPPIATELVTATQVEARSVQSTQWNALQFIKALTMLNQPPSKETPVGAHKDFDKEDQVAMAFASAAANLRMHNFKIPLQSLWANQSMAGQIVPAVATTNAIVAALVVSQLESYIKEGTSSLRFIWVKEKLSGPFATVCEPLEKKNPNCPVCSSISERLTVPKTLSARELIDRIRKEIMKGEEIVTVECHDEVIFDPDMEDDECEDNWLDVKPQTKFLHGDVLTVTSLGMQIDIVLSLVEEKAGFEFAADGDSSSKLIHMESVDVDSRPTKRARESEVDLLAESKRKHL